MSAPDRQASVADAFAQLFPGLGLLLPLEPATSFLRSQAADARAVGAFYWSKGFAAEIGFDYECVVYGAFDYGVNAFATWDGQRHWAAVSLQLIYALTELCVRVAAIMPLPGDAEPPVKLEKAERTGFRYNRADFLEPPEVSRAFFAQTSGFGHARQQLLFTLLRDAQALVWRHELFHSVLGHTRYAKATFGLGMLREKPVAKQPAAPAPFDEVSRALEFHADWAAFGSVMRLMLSGFDPSGSVLSRELGAPWRAAVSIAAALLLPVLFRFEEELHGAPPSTHPSAAARLLIFLARIDEIAHLEEAHWTWRRGAQLAISTLRQIGREYEDFAVFDRMLSEQSLERAGAERLACIDRFDTLQTALNEHALLPLGHPHQGSIEPLIVED